MDDEEFAARQEEKAQLEEARALVRGIGGSAKTFSKSPLERQLLSKVGPHALAGAYILRSLELMIHYRHALADALEDHQGLVDILREQLIDQLADPPGNASPPTSSVKKH